jgi:transcriptional regulator with XRE-family HTH domain
MKFVDAFNLTLEKFDITARELSTRSGVTDATISKFRRGNRELKLESIEKILTALPDDAYYYLMTQWANERITPKHLIKLLGVIAQTIEAGEVPAIQFPERQQPSTSSVLLSA